MTIRPTRSVRYLVVEGHTKPENGKILTNPQSGCAGGVHISLLILELIETIAGPLSKPETDKFKPSNLFSIYVTTYREIHSKKGRLLHRSN